MDPRGLSEAEYSLLLSAVHTRHGPTIAQAVSEVESVMKCLGNATGAHPGSNILGSTLPIVMTHQEASPMTHSPITPLHSSLCEYRFPVSNHQSLPSSPAKGTMNLYQASLAQPEPFDLTLPASTENLDGIFSKCGPRDEGMVIPPKSYTNTEPPARYDSSESQISPVDLTIFKRHKTLPQEKTSKHTLQPSSDEDTVLTNTYVNPSNGHHADEEKAQNAHIKENRSGYIFPSKRPRQCKICSRVVRADNFEIHQRSHTGEKPYKCPICPFRSGNPSSMPKHLRLHDSGRQVYKCQHCPYTSLYKSNLSSHSSRHHHHHQSRIAAKRGVQRN